MRVSGIKMLLILAVLSSWTQVACAGEHENRIIDQVVEAYGGSNLLNLKSLVLKDKLKRFTTGQSHSPFEVDLSHYNAVVNIDFIRGRKEMQFVGGEGDNIYIQHNEYDGKKGYRINHSDQTVSENGAYRFATVDRRFSLRIDAVLAKILHETRAGAVYEGEVLYQGEPKEKLSFQAEGYPKFTLLIDKESGLITKMSRAHWLPGTEFAYIYSRHEHEGGITFAKDVYVMKGGKPETLSVSRSLEVNPNLDGAFQVPTSYGPAPRSISFDEMSVQELSAGVFLAGQDWGFSIFVDAGPHYVAMGGYEDLKKRLAAVQAYANNTKPLKYQVVTHHHMDHLGGMGEAADLGASFITVKEHVASIRKFAGRPIEDERFIIVEGADSIENGLVKVLDFPNGHSNHNLVSYIPAAKLVFTADYFLSRQETGAPSGHKGLIEFQEALRKNDFEADFFAAAHSGRVLTSADLKAALNNIAPPETCPKNWPQCMK